MIPVEYRRAARWYFEPAPRPPMAHRKPRRVVLMAHPMHAHQQPKPKEKG